MRIVNYSEFIENDKLQKEFYSTIEYENNPDIDSIIQDVKFRGDEALIEISNRFNDGNFTTSDDFLVTKEEIKEAYDKVDKEFIKQVKIAKKNVEEFAKKQLNSVNEFEINKKKSKLGQKIVPLKRVLAYVPGGNYPLPSSCIMTTVPAKVAGVKEVILTSPRIKPETIVAADIAGADKIYKLGGAQAISAFSYGTNSIEPVDKIVGPGNRFVTYAKKSVYGKVDIDFLAGPSEVLIIADDSADPLLVAGDLLAQCEHDKDARGYLICNSKQFADKVKDIAHGILSDLKTSDIAKVSFMKSFAIVDEGLFNAVEISNKRAPEHLELVVKNENKFIDKLTNYGSLFIGSWCAEVFGDYVSGTNHVLPTNSAAKYTGGLSVFDFVKILTYQKIGEDYARELAKTASYIAGKEGLMAHKAASDFRLNRKKPKLIDRILSKQNRTQILAKLVTLYFQFKRHFYYCKNINYPKEKCIFALWHAHQCGLYALNEREKTTVMISNSADGEIIAQAGAAMGLNVVRGSHNRKGATATIEMINAIKAGNNGAITIDGPRGPKHKVKKGIIEVARLTGAPIVPMSWYSPSPFFLKFKTWDEFCFPLNCIKMKAIYGEPIYIPYNATDEELENYRLQVEGELKNLYQKLVTDFKKL